LNGPGGWWEPDSGYHFALLILRQPDDNPHLRCSIKEDALVLPDGREVQPIGFSGGKILTRGLETVFWTPLVHFEFQSSHRSVIYALLFALPPGADRFLAKVRDSQPFEVSLLDRLPDDLGSIEGSVTFRESMSIPRFLPLAHRVDPPDGITLGATPAETPGVMAWGEFEDCAIFIVRAAVGVSAVSYQATACDVRARLADGSWIEPLGLIDWLDLEDAPSVPGIFDNITYASQSKTLLPGCRCRFLHDYRGPITACCELEAKFAVAFPAKVMSAIRTIELGNDSFAVSK
jgi:hypothetical protein